MDQVLTTLKILILGESGVGKSSLLLSFTDDNFNPEQKATVGVDCETKNITIKGDTVKLSIWDTAGQERFRSITPFFYKNAHGAILVYDVTSWITFKKIEVWLDELNIYETDPNMIKMIVGNKTDLKDREVTKEDGIKLAKRHGTLFIETSAKTKEGVQSAFEELVQEIIQTSRLTEVIHNDRLHLKDGTLENNYQYKCMGYTCTTI